MENKKKNVVLYIIIGIIVLVGIFLIYKMFFNKDENTNINDISIIEFENKIKNKETFILVISQTGCSHCEQYLPELNRSLSSYDIKADVLNISNLNDEEKKILNNYVNFSGTPTTIFFIDGEEKTTLNRFVGFASEEKIVERLKSLGYTE